jgi:hypothetical protein
MLTVTFEPADDLATGPTIDILRLANGLTASPTDGHRTASNATCTDLFTKPICPELTAVFTPTAAPASIVTPEPTATPALARRGKEKEPPVVISTGITSRMTTGTTTVKTGIESSRLDACQRPPELVSVSASASTAVSVSASAPTAVPASVSAPASVFAAIGKPAANLKELVNDLQRDNHKEDVCQSDFGRWHKWKEKPQEAKIINDKRSEYRDSGDIISSPDLALFPPVSPPVSASSPPGSTPISPLAAPSTPPPDLALAPSVSPPASASSPSTSAPVSPPASAPSPPASAPIPPPVSVPVPPPTPPPDPPPTSPPFPPPD